MKINICALFISLFTMSIQFHSVNAMEYKQGLSSEILTKKQLQEEYDLLSKQLKNLQEELDRKRVQIHTLPLSSPEELAMYLKFKKDSIRDQAQNLIDNMEEKREIARKLNHQELTDHFNDLIKDAYPLSS